MKLNQAQIKTFGDASLAALETAVNAWLVTGGERQLITVLYSANGTVYSAIVVYT